MNLRGAWPWVAAAIAAFAITGGALLWSAPLLELDLLVNPDALLPQRDQVDGPGSDPPRCQGGEPAPAHPSRDPGRQ